MGGNKRGRTQRRHFRQGGGGREDVWKKPRPSQSWEPFVSHNLDFDQYYKRKSGIPHGRDVPGRATALHLALCHGDATTVELFNGCRCGLEFTKRAGVECAAGDRLRPRGGQCHDHHAALSAFGVGKMVRQAPPFLSSMWTVALFNFI